MASEPTAREAALFLALQRSEASRIALAHELSKALLALAIEHTSNVHRPLDNA